MLVNELLTAVLQVSAMSVIPVIWWLITAKKTSFFSWIGLKKPIIKEKKKFAISLCVALAIIISMSLVLDPLLPDDIQLANERFGGQGIKAFIPAVVFAFIATAFAEEILFRGFIGKRLCGKLGFYVGNTLQAILFGMLHGATMFPILGIAIPMLVIAFTGTLGWLMGYINEKSNGSIISSWLLHGISNLYAAIIIMFELL